MASDRIGRRAGCRDARRHPASPFAWCAWSLPWVADPGQHELSCRATDASGATQPLEPVWNYQGMGNNVVQRVKVTVE